MAEVDFDTLPASTAAPLPKRPPQTGKRPPSRTQRQHVAAGTPSPIAAASASRAPAPALPPKPVVARAAVGAQPAASSLPLGSTQPKSSALARSSSEAELDAALSSYLNREEKKRLSTGQDLRNEQELSALLSRTRLSAIPQAGQSAQSAAQPAPPPSTITQTSKTVPPPQAGGPAAVLPSKPLPTVPQKRAETERVEIPQKPLPPTPGPPSKTPSFKQPTLQELERYTSEDVTRLLAQLGFPDVAHANLVREFEITGARLLAARQQSLTRVFGVHLGTALWDLVTAVLNAGPGPATSSVPARATAPPPPPKPASISVTPSAAPNSFIPLPIASSAGEIARAPTATATVQVAAFEKYQTPQVLRWMAEQRLPVSVIRLAEEYEITGLQLLRAREEKLRKVFGDSSGIVMFDALERIRSATAPTSTVPTTVAPRHPTAEPTAGEFAQFSPADVVAWYQRKGLTEAGAAIFLEYEIGGQQLLRASEKKIHQNFSPSDAQLLLTHLARLRAV